MHKQINLVGNRGGHLPWVHHGYLPGANQIDLFMHFLGVIRDGLVARRVDLDTISSSESNINDHNSRFLFQNLSCVMVTFINLGLSLVSN